MDSLIGSDDHPKQNTTPMPKKQLIILAIISLAEQTALNSFSPYLPEMAATFPEVNQQKVGLFVGVIASSFAAAQFITNVFWGRISDKVGRKPVILLGTFLTGICFILFGFCQTLWQAIVIQAFMGMVNANAGVVSTVMGEITDRSNQASTFSWFPMVYGVGGLTGPIIGGLLVHTSDINDNIFGRYPYLLPNVIAALILFLDMVLSVFLLDESLEEAQSLPSLSSRLRCLFSWLWKSIAFHQPLHLRGSDDEEDEEEDVPSFIEACGAVLPNTSAERTSYKLLLVPQIIILLVTYSIFNLSNVAFNSLYPVYGAGQRPTGRELSPKEIGISLAFGGAISVIFQGFVFTPLHKRVGSLWTFRLAFLGFVISFFAMPFVGRKQIMSPPKKAEIWAELGIIVLLKNVATVSALTVSMMMITNASPKPSTLGLLNGTAQSLSAGGRAIGPLLSGALFTLSTKIKKDGEFLSWGIFGGVAFVGMVMSCVLYGGNLESDGEERAPLLSGIAAQNEEENPGA